ATVQAAIRRPIRPLVCVAFAFRGLGNELLAFAVADEILVRRMQIDAPGARKTSILKLAAISEVVGGQNQVAEQPPRFALAGDVRSPAQPVVGVKMINVLESVPGAVHRPQVLVAHPFDILDRILVETRFPEPVAESIRRAIAAEALVETFASR